MIAGIIAGISIVGLIILAVGGVLYNTYRGREDMGIK